MKVAGDSSRGGVQSEWHLRLVQAVPRASPQQLRELLDERPASLWVPDSIWHTPYQGMLRELAVRAAREARADLVTLLADERGAPVDRDTLAQAFLSGCVTTARAVLDRLRARPPGCPLRPGDVALAASSGSLALCEWLVERGALASGPPPDGSLGDPAETGDVAMLHWLLRHGADPNGADWLSGPPLARAVAAGNVEATRLLLEAGARPDQPHRDRWPIQIALEAGSAGCLSALLEAGASREQRLAGIEEWSDSEMHPTLLAVTGRGDTPLLRALRLGRPELAQLLAAAGADPGAVNDDGESVALLAKARPPG